MQQVEYTVPELLSVTESIVSGVGEIDLLSYKTTLQAKLSLLQGVLQKKVLVENRL